MRQTIHDAYDRLTPGDDAKERMLRNILSAADTSQRTENERKRHMKHKRILTIAAIAAALLSLSIAAYATGFFGLGDVHMEVPDPTDAVADAPGAFLQETGLISLQGRSDTPEYQACAEYNAFAAAYDPDGSILEAVGNNPTGLDSKYDAYLCYSQEMADKIAEICEKYDLQLTENVVLPDTVEDMFSALGISGVHAAGAAEQKSVYSGYYYENGTFQFEGNTTISGEFGYFAPIEYQFRCCRRGAFDTVVLNLGNIEEYEQWAYTNASGDTMLLALSSTKAVILADLPESFITINVLYSNYGDILTGEVHMSREALQVFADSFDLSELQ